MRTYFLLLIFGLASASNVCQPDCECNLETKEVICNATSAVLPGHINSGTFNCSSWDRRWVIIKELNLQNNAITKIDEDTFKGCDSLTTLDLSSNQLTSVPKNAFYWCPNLEELYFINNPIKGIHKDDFYILRKLKFLDLSFTQIRHLSSDVFAKLRSLEVLILSNSRIKVIASSAFSGLNNLKVLRIDNNDLSQIPVEVLNDTRELTFRDLRGNPWHCDCRMKSAVTVWLQSPNHFEYDPWCSSPAHLKDRIWSSLDCDDFICPFYLMNNSPAFAIGVIVSLLLLVFICYRIMYCKWNYQLKLKNIEKAFEKQIKLPENRGDYRKFQV